MATPDFILSLRKKVGHDLLWLPAVTGVVLDDADRVLLVQRIDNGRWTLPAGILEPGEHPAPGLVREVYEETAVETVVEALVSVEAHGPREYPNGDVAQYLDLAFRLRPIAGVARVNDDESLDVGWFPADDLPDIPPREARCVANALRRTDQPWYVVPPGAAG
jgi:8-oxo-dGTP pyrophosphatase MutT (NUDIX family)